MNTEQKLRDERAAAAVKSALHSLNVALDEARSAGLTADVKVTERLLVGSAPLITVNARLTRQSIEFDAKL